MVNSQKGVKTMMKKCQCHKCKHIFDYSELSEDVSQRHLSPCCNSSYTVLDRELDRFFEKYLDVNNDKRYYEYGR